MKQNRDISRNLRKPMDSKEKVQKLFKKLAEPHESIGTGLHRAVQTSERPFQLPPWGAVPDQKIESGRNASRREKGRNEDGQGRNPAKAEHDKGCYEDRQNGQKIIHLDQTRPGRWSPRE